MKANGLISKRALSVLLVVPLLLTACSVKIPVLSLPEGSAIQSLGSISAKSPLAWHPAGDRFALNRSGLVVQNVDGNPLKIDSSEPAAIAWSPTGTFLAASFSSRTSAVIRIFSADYSQLAEVDLDGSVRDIAWVSDSELLLAAVQVKEYSFGANYQVVLHHWTQNEELKSVVLADTSPLTSNLKALGDAIYSPVHLRISPYRDEIVFSRLVMPPNAEMHYKLVARHLASGAERVIANLPLGTTGGRYLLAGKRLFFSDGIYQSINRSIWGTEAYETYPPGQRLEVSPGGRYKVIDNSFLRDRDVLFDFDDVGIASFSPDGKKLLFASGRNLFLLTDLDDGDIRKPDIGIKLLELRRWRSEGLITPQEFEKYVRKLEK